MWMCVIFTHMYTVMQTHAHSPEEDDMCDLLCPLLPWDKVIMLQWLQYIYLLQSLGSKYMPPHPGFNMGAD